MLPSTLFSAEWLLGPLSESAMGNQGINYYYVLSCPQVLVPERHGSPLWRTVNLIVFHGVLPEEIFLATFTEKAALKLREGLRGLFDIREVPRSWNPTQPLKAIAFAADKHRHQHRILDHEGGKGALRRRNKVAVFNRDGDAIFSDSTRELGNSVKDACAAIMKGQATQKK
ncbi:MAG: hypothetical protein AUH86_19610 [Acidobacteria bacterium 13_1_40CM_4_58_4]|nr:MAG: hypothetical protein AUH86_19610 [Acidobacteria bacterium 13_1_40CM_4_58_4]